MLVLTGDTRATALLAELKRLGWGRMFVTQTPTPYEGEPWGFDNGAFGAWLVGQAFEPDVFKARLDAPGWPWPLLSACYTPAMAGRLEPVHAD